MAGIRNIQSVSEPLKHFYGVTINAGVVVCRKNIGTLPTIAPFLKKYNVDQVFFIRVKAPESMEPINPENARANLLSAIDTAQAAGISTFTVGFINDEWNLPNECSYERFIETDSTFEPSETFDTRF